MGVSHESVAKVGCASERYRLKKQSAAKLEPWIGYQKAMVHETTLRTLKTSVPFCGRVLRAKESQIALLGLRLLGNYFVELTYTLLAWNVFQAAFIVENCINR